MGPGKAWLDVPHLCILALSLLNRSSELIEMYCVGLGRRKGTQQLNHSHPGSVPMLPSPHLAHHSLPGWAATPGMTFPPTQPHLGAKPDIFLSLCPPHLTLAKLGCRAASGVSAHWERERTQGPLFTKLSSSTPHDARRKFPAGTPAMAPS